MLYAFNADDELRSLPVFKSIRMEECNEIALLSQVSNTKIEEIRKRLANDNKAFVAWYNETPAAFGWMAMGKAFIGELNHELILPLGHRYLWNFRTLESFRGMGIYPRLLQYILTAEKNSASKFWILHAPENHASKKGIEKAGFRFAGQVSVANLDMVFTDSQENDAHDLGFISSDQEQASCWMCASPYLSHKKTSCCCSSQERICNERLFVPA